MKFSHKYRKVKKHQVPPLSLTRVGFVSTFFTFCLLNILPSLRPDFPPLPYTLCVKLCTDTYGICPDGLAFLFLEPYSIKSC